MNRIHAVIAFSAVAALVIGLATEPHANVAPEPTVGPRADRLDAETRRTPCRVEAWPYISGECVSRSNRLEEPRLATRTVTIEQRPQPGVSVLTRVPVEAVAER